MRPDFSLLSSDPLIYFLLHSTAFVVIIAAIFFAAGLIFGWLTWAKYKKQRREALAECESLKDDIVTLKRKLAEQASRASLAVDAPLVEVTPQPRPADAEPDSVISSFLDAAAAILHQNPGSSVVPTAPPPAEPQVAPLEPPAPVHESPMPATHARKPSTTAKVKPKHRTRHDEEHDTRHREEQDTPVNPPSSERPVVMTEHLMPETPAAADPASVIVETDHSPPLPASNGTSHPHQDPQRGLVYSTPPGLADDLSHLRGVASVIERKLNDYGVFTFKQIALWSHENIHEFSNLLAFKDRIRREQWVEQARELHFQKYGERV